MRTLGILGGPLSGAPPIAQLGAGVPSASTYLRGDGTWSPIALGTFPRLQRFTSSGSFTVPTGVTSVMALCYGAGSGGCGPGTATSAGGASSFGSLLTCSGGGGANGTTATPGGPGTVSCDTANTLMFGFGSSHDYGPYTSTYGDIGTWGFGSAAQGGPGSMAVAVCTVTPGQAVTVTIGAGSAGAGSGGTSGQPGLIVLRY